MASPSSAPKPLPKARRQAFVEGFLRLPRHKPGGLTLKERLRRPRPECYRHWASFLPCILRLNSTIQLDSPQVCGEEVHEVGLHHRGFYAETLLLLVGVVDVGTLRSEPRQHLAKLSLLRPMSQYEHGLGINSLFAEKIIEFHGATPLIPLPNYDGITSRAWSRIARK